MPDIRALSRTYIPKAVNIARPFLWTHKNQIIGAAAISVFAWKLIRDYRNRPTYPNVTLRSSLNFAKLSIDTSKSEEVPPNVRLVFCIDASSSMQGNRENAVKLGVNQVLDSAKGVINVVEGAQIEIAMIGFCEEAQTICDSKMITSSNFDKIKENLQGYRSNGTTNIIAGLDKATTALEAMTEGSRTLILLTDGEQRLDSNVITSIHSRLAKIRAKLFAVGIGKNHNKITLQQIAPPSGKFTGKYIDTTLERVSIESVISTIYKQAVASFNNLVLRTSQLEGGTWSVDGASSVIEGGGSKYQLGSFTEEEGIVKTIQIDSKKLKKPLDLSNVTFELDFSDPRGRKGTVVLPWNPNTIMNPKILGTVPG